MGHRVVDRPRSVSTEERGVSRVGGAFADVDVKGRALEMGEVPNERAVITS
jgi:hypothetical protein